MSFVLYSTPVQLRSREIMVPPMSMYHMRRLLELKDSGTDFDNPDSNALLKILGLIVEVIQENYPDITQDELAREIDTHNLAEIMAAMQSIPKNQTALAGMTNQTMTSPQATS